MRGMSHVSWWPIASHVLKMLPHPSGLMVDLGGAMWGRSTQRDKPTEKLLPSGIKVKSCSASLDRRLLKSNNFVRVRVSGTINHVCTYTVWPFYRAEMFVLCFCCYTSSTRSAKMRLAAELEWWLVVICLHFKAIHLRRLLHFLWPLWRKAFSIVQAVLWALGTVS